MAFPFGYSAYQVVALSNPTGELTNFPYMMNANLLPDSWWSQVKSDGGDVQVYKTDGTRLPVCLHNWNYATKSGLILFGYSGTKLTSAESIRIYAGNSNVSQPAVGAAFGQHAVFPSSVRGCWLAGGGDDVTSFLNHTTGTGSPTVGGVAGPFSGSTGTAFNGTSQFFSGNVSVITAAPLSFLANVYCTNNTLNNTVIGLWDTGNVIANHFFMSLAGNAVGDPIRAWSTQANGFSQGSSASGYSINTWACAGGVIASATSRQGGINGVLGTAETTGRVPTGIDGIRIGVYHTNTNADFFAGNMSTIMMFDAAISAAWYAYHSAMTASGTQSTFYTLGDFVDLKSGSSKVSLGLGIGF